MFEEIIVAGTGGQGVLLLGEVLSIGSLHKGNRTTWLPSYGPEMRGGTANCSVVISSREIGSPMVEHPTLLVCFNQPSMDKFGASVRAGGTIFANSDAIERYPELDGIEVVKIPVASLAAELGNERILNMVLLGAVLKRKPIIEMEQVCRALTYIWGEKKAGKLLAVNQRAIQRGMECA